MSERYQLVGDEAAGVQLICNESACWNAGRPLAYYCVDLAGYPFAYDDAVRVDSIETLLAVRDKHEREQHGGPVRMTEEVVVTITPPPLDEAIVSGLRTSIRERRHGDFGS